MCCYHEVTLGSKETKECVEKPVTDSGYYYTQSHKSSTGENERDTLSCTINIDICYKEGGSAKECSEYSKNVKGGLCCLDKESDFLLLFNKYLLFFSAALRMPSRLFTSFSDKYSEL